MPLRSVASGVHRPSSKQRASNVIQTPALDVMEQLRRGAGPWCWRAPPQSRLSRALEEGTLRTAAAAVAGDGVDGLGSNNPRQRRKERATAGRRNMRTAGEKRVQRLGRYATQTVLRSGLGVRCKRARTSVGRAVGANVPVFYSGRPKKGPSSSSPAARCSMHGSETRVDS